MDKLMKFNSLLHDEEEREWTFRYKTKEVIGQMEYMRSMWDDNASRELWKSFAIPFDDSSSILVTYMQKVFGISASLHSGYESLFKSCVQVSGLSEEIREKLKVTEREQASCERSVTEGKDDYLKIEHDAPIVDQEFQEWNSDEATFQHLLRNRKSLY